MKNTMNTPVAIPVSKLHPFEGHPYKVLDNEEMNTLIESIQTQGVLSPLIVRPMENTTDEYEVVSGHRRLHAAVKAGLETVPAFIYALDRDAAAITLVDSNLHREHILPSEKAFAYKMKLDAMKHQGVKADIASRQVVGKSESADLVSADESGRTVQRYIRLTRLIPELLSYMDAGKMALSVGVELSYLSDPCQRDLLELCEANDCTPSYSQAFRLKNLYRDGQLTKENLSDIMNEEKANQREKVSFPMKDLRRFFPADYTPQEIQRTILQLLENERQRQQRCRNDAR